jgi:hypothetical protein
MPANACPHISITTGDPPTAVLEMGLVLPTLEATRGYRVPPFVQPLDLAERRTQVAITCERDGDVKMDARYEVEAEPTESGWRFSFRALAPEPHQMPSGIVTIAGDIAGEARPQVGYSWELEAAQHRFRGGLILTRFVQAAGFSTADLSRREAKIASGAKLWLRPTAAQKALWRDVRIAPR